MAYALSADVRFQPMLRTDPGLLRRIGTGIAENLVRPWINRSIESGGFDRTLRWLNLMPQWITRSAFNIETAERAMNATLRDMSNFCRVVNLVSDVNLKSVFISNTGLADRAMWFSSFRSPEVASRIVSLLPGQYLSAAFADVSGRANERNRNILERLFQRLVVNGWENPGITSLMKYVPEESIVGALGPNVARKVFLSDVSNSLRQMAFQAMPEDIRALLADKSGLIWNQYIRGK